MGEIGDFIRIAEYLTKIPSTIKNKFDANDSIKLADNYYQKNIIDLALVIIENAIEKNKTDKDKCSWLHFLKGDLLIEKGMQLYQDKVKCANIFERSIEEFAEVIRLDPFNPIAWLGKGFNHVMVGLIYAENKENESKVSYNFYQTIYSVDAGLGSLEENGPNAEVEQNLWALKGGAFLLLGKDEEGDECFEKAGIETHPKRERADYTHETTNPGTK